MLDMIGPRRNDPCPCGRGERFKRCHGRVFGRPPIPRDITEAVRFVCFETHLKDFRLATNGGTALVVKYRERRFAVTCRHVLRGFSIDDLVITDSIFGQRVAGIRGMYYPDKLSGDVAGSDLEDLCVIDFRDDDETFFEGVYDLDSHKVAISEPADRLVVSGFLKYKSWIAPPNIFAGVGFLEFTDAGITRFDQVLRQGLATYRNLDFDSIAGISGAPVYNCTRQALSGIVARGALQENGCCIMYYIDIFDIMHFLNAVSNQSNKVNYVKDRMIL